MNNKYHYGADEIGLLVIILACIASWFTHILFCFAHGAWGFLIAGALFFPIGIIHGVYLWFN